MRVVLDTNILVSALLVQGGHPGAIYRAWANASFTLLSCAQQLEELHSVLRKPALAGRIRPHQAGRLVNELKELAGSGQPKSARTREGDASQSA